jgi:hypothetical protein
VAGSTGLCRGRFSHHGTQPRENASLNRAVYSSSLFLELDSELRDDPPLDRDDESPRLPRSPLWPPDLGPSVNFPSSSRRTLPAPVLDWPLRLLPDECDALLLPVDRLVGTWSSLSQIRNLACRQSGPSGGRSCPMQPEYQSRKLGGRKECGGQCPQRPLMRIPAHTSRARPSDSSQTRRTPALRRRLPGSESNLRRSSLPSRPCRPAETNRRGWKQSSR